MNAATSMNDGLPWYDSVWLGKYFAARQIVARHAPDRLGAFEAALAPLRTDPGFTVKHLPGLIDPATLAGLREVVRGLDPASLVMDEAKAFGRFLVRNVPGFAQLQIDLTEQVSVLAGEELEPCYSFLSLYTRLGVCPPHLDSPSAKWTLDICLDQSEPWPIHLSQIIDWPEGGGDLGRDWQAAIKHNPALQFTPHVLTPGDAILFSGSSQWHYRDAMPPGKGKRFCDLLFLHYIPSGAAQVVVPGNWPDYFGIPELAEIPDLEGTY